MNDTAVVSDYYNQMVTDRDPIHGTPLWEVWQTELGFSKRTAAIGLDRTTSEFISEDGILFRPDPIRVKDMMTKNEPWPLVFRTLAEFIDVSASGDFGYAAGVYEVFTHVPMTEPVMYGFFSAIWKKGKDGKWTAAIGQDVDMGNNKLENYPFGMVFPQGADQHRTFDPVNISDERLILILLEMEHLKKWLNKPMAETYLKFLDPKARVYRDKVKPAIDSPTIHSLMSDIQLFSWESLGSDVAASGDLGYTYGSFDFKKGKDVQKGYYLRVWKKQPDNKWKIVLDMFSEASMPPLIKLMSS
jgi:ketosteroid isomerase-like protein